MGTHSHQDVWCVLCLDILPRTTIDIPQPTASTFLGGWLGLKTWIQPRNGCRKGSEFGGSSLHILSPLPQMNRPSLEAIQVWSGRTWPIFAPDVPISSHSLSQWWALKTNSHGAHHLPSTSNYIQLSNYHYWWANLQHVSILNCLQPWDCSTDGGARWVEGSRQVIPVGQRLVC